MKSMKRNKMYKRKINNPPKRQKPKEYNNSFYLTKYYDLLNEVLI